MDRLLHFAIVALEWIFFLGITGSALVILLTSLEDVKVLLQKEHPPEPQTWS